MHRFILPALAALLATTAQAAPVLKSEVTINRPIVTVGDMFEDAGLFAEKALFRAPAPGTTGLVSLEAVRAAALQVGLTEYDQDNVISVRVERPAAIVDAAAITALIEAELARRGQVQPGVEVVARFDAEPHFKAEAVSVPATLGTLSYQPGAAMFTARVKVEGMDMPVDVSGRLDFVVEVPHLAVTRQAGEILVADDIVMKPVALGFVEQTGIGSFDDLVGKQLKRNAREGMMLRATDVTEPLTVRRNTKVTVLLKTGTMTLTVIGQAMTDASAGQPVQVMNTVSRKILNGVATASGAVEMTTAADLLKVAGL